MTTALHRRLDRLRAALAPTAADCPLCRGGFTALLVRDSDQPDPDPTDWPHCRRCGSAGTRVLLRIIEVVIDHADVAGATCGP